MKCTSISDRNGVKRAKLVAECLKLEQHLLEIRVCRVLDHKLEFHLYGVYIVQVRLRALQSTMVYSKN